MTTTVAELIKFLETQDQEAIVQVMVTEEHSYSSSTTAVDFDPDNEDHIEYFDFRDNKFTTPDSAWYGKRFLVLGG